jgi:hypothetical protein
MLSGCHGDTTQAVSKPQWYYWSISRPELMVQVGMERSCGASAEGLSMVIHVDLMSLKGTLSG